MAFEAATRAFEAHATLKQGVQSDLVPARRGRSSPPKRAATKRAGRDDAPRTAPATDSAPELRRRTTAYDDDAVRGPSRLRARKTRMREKRACERNAHARPRLHGGATHRPVSCTRRSSRRAWLSATRRPSGRRRRSRRGSRARASPSMTPSPRRSPARKSSSAATPSSTARSAPWSSRETRSTSFAGHAIRSSRSTTSTGWSSRRRAHPTRSSATASTLKPG
ncbi:hypothetical protein M885DRAFT_552022 [Pelagophyceae sp. CCMP2097]|nr:hypothetical protein M885DRAFT_552022 [Pelagophyceae sp. CCMP2097]